MGFSDVMTGKYKLVHAGSVPVTKLGQVADLLGMSKKDKTALLKGGKIHLVQSAKKAPRKTKKP
jgi:hypothetical protein